METLTSPNNDRVKMVTKLMKSAKERRNTALYAVEGVRMTQEIPEDDLDTLFFTQDFYDKSILGNDRLKRLVDCADHNGKCFVVSDSVIKHMCDTETPQGILALVRMRKNELDDIFGDGSEPPLILIVERLQDPGNMGTSIRAAEGAGVTGILVSFDSVDIYSPKVIRSTMGSVFRKKIVVSRDLLSDIEKLKEKGVSVFGMHLDGSTMYETDLTGPVAFLIGNEGAGLSDEVSRSADKLIKIPMKGEVESLNAAVSASLISYEAMRQRDKQKL